MRKIYWYVTAYLKKHGFIVGISLLIAVLVFWFIIPPVVDSLAVQSRHYVGVIGEYTLADLPDEVEQQISIGLTTIAEDGSAAPGLAERWTIEQDGTTYRFVLKNNVFWQDGTPVTPGDVQYSFPDVERIVTPNDIVFKLPDAYAPFPTTVSQPLLKSGEIKQLFFFTKPSVVGIGAYRITGYRTRGSALDELIVDGNQERYIYRFYQTEEDAVTAFRRGEVDTVPGLARKFDVYDWQTTTVEEKLNFSQYVAIFFNTQSPLFTKNVRQALSYALPKPTGDQRALGPINPQSWAYLPGGKTYEQDWERGSERILDELPGEPLSIDLTTTNLFADEAEEIKQTWEEFGQKVYDDCQASSAITEKERCENAKISVQIRIQSFPDTSNFEALLIGQRTPPDPDQYSMWHSGESTNFTGYKNTRIDNLLEKGRQTYDQRERTEIYQEFQQFFLEDPPAIFLHYLWNYELQRKSALEYKPESKFIN